MTCDVMVSVLDLIALLLTRFGLASDLTEHKRQSTCGGSRSLRIKNVVSIDDNVDIPDICHFFYTSKIFGE